MSMNVLLPQPLGLLDLPDDVLQIVLSRRFLTPTALVEVACVSKAAAAVALPELYSDLLIPSIAAFPLIYSTLGTHPELANHVRSATASRYLALSYRFQKHEPAAQQCRPCPDSPIVSVDDAMHRLGPDPLLDHLPIPWLVRIADLCPHLTAVDMSYMDEFNTECTFLTLGLRTLADTLRARRGRFHCRSWPVSCVLVRDRFVTPEDYQKGNARFEPDVYFVDSVDWGAKRINVTDFGCSRASVGTDFCLVPFRELVPLDDQPNWAIGNALLRNSANKFDLINNGRWIVGPWLKSKSDLWLKAGLAHGEDRVFDFAQGPALVKGTITLGLPMIDLMDALPDSLRAHTHQQCTELIFDGADPGIVMATPEEDKRPVIDTMLRILSMITDRPLEFVTSLRFTSAYFIDEATVSQFMHILAQGAPNLEQLDLLNVPCPPDFVLNHADALVRRCLFPGKLLHKLSVSSYVPDPADHVPSPKLSSLSDWQLAGTHTPRSLLGRGHPRSQLSTLELELVGPGIDFIDSSSAATVAIHPELLRQLTSLTLQSVKLYLPPPELAQPDSPSFMPLAHIHRAVPLTHHFTLPNLTHLNLSSNALHLPPAICTPRYVLASLPTLPALTQLALSVDVVHESSMQLGLALIPDVLARMPGMEFARFAYVATGRSNEAERARAVEDLFFREWPREMGTCPRLRGVQVNEDRPVEYYTWARERMVL